MARQRRGIFGSGEPLFQDRAAAGRVLAEHLEAYRGPETVVLAIPRGGVPVAATVARQLDVDLDVIVARKLGAPGSPELAIGAVTANGGRFLNDEIIAHLGVSPEYVDEVTNARRREARERETRLRGTEPMTQLAGRTVILVDDGLATGATMRAAVRSVRQSHPARIVVAVPVGSQDACAALRREADVVVCPFTPEHFAAVGYFYTDFTATEDAEVEAILAELRDERRQKG